MISTERLFLRPFTESDAPFFLELLNDPDWIRFIGDRRLRTVEDARRFLLEVPIASFERDGHGFLLVSLQAPQGGPGTPIGLCSLLRRDALPDLDIGYALLPAFRGQGYAQEAAAATIRHARDVFGIRRVVALTQPENVRSIHVLEALGLRYVSPFRFPDHSTELSLYALDELEALT